MAVTVTKVNQLTNVGNIQDGDVLVGERVDGTTVRINYVAGGGGGTPGGSDTQLQYNNSGSFGGISQMTYNGTNISLTTGFTIDGTADEIQLKVQGHSTQTANIFEVEDSAAANLFTVDSSGNVTVAGTVDGRDLATDGTKLDGIESGATADQSAAEIKTAYESNADTNAFTDADESKLDGIESGATADQSAAEIKTAYESNADTNAFTDADESKLDGIEALADVTDATNVDVALGETNGIITRTADDTFTGRTITGTASRVSVSNGDGVAGNPTLDIDSAYVGQTSITTLGTIATGTWQGTTIAVDQGGTGQASYTNGQLLIGNTTGNTLTKATLTEGEGIDVTNGTGTITIAGEDASATNKGIATFDVTDFTVTAGDVTINAERIQDITGAMFTGNTETGITVTYQDVDGTIDLTVSDTTVAGDTGSTGMTPGDTLTIAGGTNATTAMSGDTLTVNVDDAFLLNDGDTGTGVYDFGGATSFEIPNGAAPTVNAAGEIAVDTTITDYTGLIKYHDGTEELSVVAMPTANLSTTDGDVVAYNATNNEFEMSAPSAGDWVLVSSATASNSTSIDFTGLSSTYIAYKVVYTQVKPATDGANWYFRTSTNNGSSYDSGASDYKHSRFAPAMVTSTTMEQTGDNADSQIVLTGVVGNASGESVNGEITIFEPSAAEYTYMSWIQTMTTNTGTGYPFNGGGIRLATSDVDAVRFLFSTGNISSGEFRLYGLKAS